jgi:hypothetical protein
VRHDLSREKQSFIGDHTASASSQNVSAVDVRQSIAASDYLHKVTKNLRKQKENRRKSSVDDGR